MEIVRDLFSQCSHQEQLALLQELPRFLCRDFLTLLPQTVVPLILRYLEPIHVIKNCVKVCSRWKHVILHCQSYWKAQYFKLHKTIITTSTSFRELAIKTLKFESRLQRRHSTSTISYSKESYLPIGSSFNWCYEVNMHFIEHFSSSLSKPLSFKVDSSNIDRNMRVLWSWSTVNCGIFYGNNGTWTLISYPVIDPSLPLNPPLKTKVWQDDICSPSHFAFGGCPNCHLVVKVVKHINQDDGTWTVEVVKLTDGPTDEVAVEKLHFHFLPDPELLTSALFTVRSVNLHPSVDTIPSSQAPFCVRHQLFIQIGIGIVIQELICHERITFKLSKISHKLCPGGYAWSDDGNPSCSNFAVSKDKTLVAIMPKENIISVWNLKDASSYSHLITSHLLRQKSSVNKIFVVSVGQLYSVVCLVRVGSHSTVDVIFLSTTTGRRVFVTNVSLTAVCDSLSISANVCLDEAVLWTRNETCYLMCFYDPLKMDFTIHSFIIAI